MALLTGAMETAAAVTPSPDFAAGAAVMGVFKYNFGAPLSPPPRIPYFWMLDFEDLKLSARVYVPCSGAIPFEGHPLLV